jgi:hypothetical protein
MRDDSCEGKRMKRLWRLILIAFITLSLALCLATVSFWVRSYSQTCELVSFQREGEHRRFYVSGGRIGIDNIPQSRYEDDEYRDSGKRFSRLRAELDALLKDKPIDGLSPREREKASKISAQQTALLKQLRLRPTPYWSHSTPIALPLILTLFAILPAVAFIRFCGTRRRRRLGLCPSCGYDLRATPDRCPECGTISAKAKA